MMKGLGLCLVLLLRADTAVTSPAEECRIRGYPYLPHYGCVNAAGCTLSPPSNRRITLHLHRKLDTNLTCLGMGFVCEHCTDMELSITLVTSDPVHTM